MEMEDLFCLKVQTKYKFSKFSNKGLTIRKMYHVYFFLFPVHKYQLIFESFHSLPKLKCVWLFSTGLNGSFLLCF